MVNFRHQDEVASNSGEPESCNESATETLYSQIETAAFAYRVEKIVLACILNANYFISNVFTAESTNDYIFSNFLLYHEIAPL